MAIIAWSHYRFAKVRCKVDFRMNMKECAEEFDNSNHQFTSDNFSDWKGGQTGLVTRIQYLIDPTKGDQITISEGIRRIRAVGFEPNGICDIVAFKNDADELWSQGVIEIIGGAKYCRRKIEQEIVSRGARIYIVPSLMLQPDDRGLHLHDEEMAIESHYNEEQKITWGHFFAAHPQKHTIGWEI